MHYKHSFDEIYNSFYQYTIYGGSGDVRHTKAKLVRFPARSLSVLRRVATVRFPATRTAQCIVVYRIAPLKLRLRWQVRHASACLPGSMSRMEIVRTRAGRWGWSPRVDIILLKILLRDC